MPERSASTSKRLFRTNEVCQLTDTQPYILRFWESEFPQLNPQRQGGQAVYRREDVDLVLRIKRLLYDEEYTIDGARKRLEQELSGAVEAPPVAIAEPRGTAERAAQPAIELVEPAEPENPQVEAEAIPRERYEDALEEIAHLRLKLREAEAAGRKLETRVQKAEQGLERTRERAARARLRLEELLGRLGPAAGPG